ncbi:MAG: glycosyltransferase [Peptococcaceae bacterium]|nr:glycosyltransferase [Peptococcaceae bacterium]
MNLAPLLRYLAEKDIPTVLTLHDCWFFTGKCTHYTEAGCYKWQTGCHHCPKLRGDIPSWFFDRTEEMWREKKELFSAIPRLAVIGVSDWITGEAKKSVLKDAMILQRIYNWIDPDVFYPRGPEVRKSFGISENKFAVLCVGAAWDEKSPKTKDLLALAKMLPESYEIILAGSVPFADRLPQNIKTVGYISSTEELAKLYSACDVYVHLSREDTFGKVIAEAISCGTPAVVYDSTACPEIVGEGCGYIVPTGDLDSALRAIEKLKRNDTETVLKCCRQFALDNFDKEKLINETIAIYENIMN